MPQVNPYITFSGTCEEAFNFYKSVFGGGFQYIGRFSEMPDNDKIPEEAKNYIMHVSLPISKETILMGSDALDTFGHVMTTGNNISISINAESEEEATRLFNGLSAGGRITMPLEKTFWGSFFGMFTDKFGINWMVNHDTQPKE